MSELDRWHIARLLIDKHGADAEWHVAQLATKALVAGVPRAKHIWADVLRKVRHLQRDTVAA